MPESGLFLSEKKVNYLKRYFSFTTRTETPPSIDTHHACAVVASGIIAYGPTFVVFANEIPYLNFKLGL